MIVYLKCKRCIVSVQTQIQEASGYCITVITDKQ